MGRFFSASLRKSFADVTRRKGRTLLVVLGIFIGVFGLTAINTAEDSLFAALTFSLSGQRQAAGHHSGCRSSRSGTAAHAAICPERQDGAISDHVHDAVARQPGARAYCLCRSSAIPICSTCR